MCMEERGERRERREGWEENRREEEDQECLKLHMPTNRNSTMLTFSVHLTYV